MTDKALLVGINKYPGAPLNGCVNDITDMADFLVQSFGFKMDDIRLLVDERATASEIMLRLNWLVEGAKPGDRLLFHYSGHGARVPSRNDKGEVDKLDEVICPVDFDWSVDKMIIDDQFHNLFLKVPKGVNFIWISDSCHSGDLTKEMPKLGKKVKLQKNFPIPADIAWKQETAKEKAIPLKQFVHPQENINLVLISGCRKDQTSSDATFNGRSNGALTYFLLRNLKKYNNKSLQDVVEHTRKDLKKARYTQAPQIEGSLDLIGSGLFTYIPVIENESPVL